MKDLPKLLASIILCEMAGIASLPFTLTSIPLWYVTLTKPSFSPPNWLFGPVWTILYFLMGISLFLVWKLGARKKVKTAILIFLFQLALNFLWSLLFFGLHSPLLGLIDISLLWFLIVVTLRSFLPLSKTAFYLLVPYFFWVTFATLLNASIFFLNAH